MNKNKKTYFRPEVEDVLDRPLDLLQFLTGRTKRELATEALKAYLIKNFEELGKQNSDNSDLAQKWYAYMQNDFKEVVTQ